MSESSKSEYAQGGWIPPEVVELQALIAGYRIEAMVGRGGMGAVYRAEHEALGRTVAIKLLPEFLTSEREGAGEADVHQFVERFRREARAMAGLDHPAILSVYNFGQTSVGHLYIVMEYVDGMDIDQYIQAVGGKVDPEHAVAIVSHVLDGLNYAHTMGIVHRDIKPANVLINQEGKVKIADFGLARQALIDDHDATLAAQLTLTIPEFAIGTPVYIAPEALDEGGLPDHRADLYAVGVMFYRMLVGKLPRGLFEPASEVVEGLDPRFDPVIARAMDSAPGRRYQLAGEFRAALDEIQNFPPRRVQAEQTGAEVGAAMRPRQFNLPSGGRTAVVYSEASGDENDGRSTPSLASRWWLVIAGVATVVAVFSWSMWPGSRDDVNGDAVESVGADAIAPEAETPDEGELADRGLGGEAMVRPQITDINEAETATSPGTRAAMLISPSAHCEPGKINGVGTVRGGEPVDFSLFRHRADVIKVVANQGFWFALTRSGEVLGQKSAIRWKDVADIDHGTHSGFLVITNGGEVFSMGLKALGDAAPKDIKDPIGISIGKNQVISWNREGKAWIWNRDENGISAQALVIPPPDWLEGVAEAYGMIGWGMLLYKNGDVRCWSTALIGEIEALRGKILAVQPGIYHMIAVLSDGRVVRLKLRGNRIEIKDLFTVASPTTTQLGFTRSSKHVLYREGLEHDWKLYLCDGAVSPPNITKAVADNPRARFMGIVCHPIVLEIDRKVANEDYAFWIE